MRTLTLISLGLLALALGACNVPVGIGTSSGEPTDDCDGCDDLDDPDVGNDDTEDIPPADTCDGYELDVEFTSPGGVMYGSMWCHLEFLDDLTTSFDNWHWTVVHNWTNRVQMCADPGIISALRANCTFCPQGPEESNGYHQMSEPEGEEAEALGCTWLAYGQYEEDAHFNGNIETTYLGYAYTAGLITFEGEGSSALVDF